MADPVRLVVVRNDLDKLAVELAHEAAQLVAETANRIEADMKGVPSSRIASTIKTQASNGGRTVTVYAGDRGRAFHAGLKEYGTVTSPATPFATPAAEHARPQFMSKLRGLLDRGL